MAKMIDLSTIKNKSIVTIEYAGKPVDCEVIIDHGAGITIKLPDDSLCVVPKPFVQAVKTAEVKQPTQSTNEQHSRDL